jgi:hypothetical protein
VADQNHHINFGPPQLVQKPLLPHEVLHELDADTRRGVREVEDGAKSKDAPALCGCKATKGRSKEDFAAVR